MQALNQAFNGEFLEFQKAIADHPELTDGGSVTWTRTLLYGQVEQVILTRDSVGNYSFEEDEAAEEAPTSFVRVVLANLISTGGGGISPAEIRGTLSIDFSAIASVVSTASLRGQESVAFDFITDPSKPAPGKKENITVAFTSLSLRSDDQHGPRTGSYTQVREPQIGESLQFTASLVLLCPANPSGAVSDTQSVERKYKTSDGTTHSRGDGTASGGQLPAGSNWVEARCSASRANFRLAKLEDSSGNTVEGSVSGSPSTACDAAFGAAPQVSSNATDFNFSGVPTFPGEY